MEFSQNRSQTSSRAGSLAGLQPASELDSVMEFGLKQMQQPENIISSMLKIVWYETVGQYKQHHSYQTHIET